MKEVFILSIFAFVLAGAIYAILLNTKHAVCDHTKLRIGMSSEELLSACEAPDRKNFDVFIHSVHVQWVYGYTYVYTENGTVTTFQWSE